MNQKGIKFAD